VDRHSCLPFSRLKRTSCLRIRRAGVICAAARYDTRLRVLNETKATRGPILLTASPSASRKSSRSLIPRRANCVRTSANSFPRLPGHCGAGKARAAPVHRETGTRICENVSELRIEMHARVANSLRRERAGLQVAAAGTHPFSSWIDQVISPGERYQHIVEEMGQLARSLLIFGMHVHVAMPDKQTTIDMMTGCATSYRTFWPFRPVLPFGWKKHRIEVFPHHGVSPVPRTVCRNNSNRGVRTKIS